MLKRIIGTQFVLLGHESSAEGVRLKLGTKVTAFEASIVRDIHSGEMVALSVMVSSSG